MEPLPAIPKPLEELSQRLRKLPGIGARSSLQIAISIARDETEAPERLAQAITEARQDVRPCRNCRAIAEDTLCPICADETRIPHQICVVTESQDVPALEKLRIYRGRYHVLHGLLEPLRGVTPDKLTISQLMRRLKRLADNPMAELILATPDTLEGNMTADYIRQECLARGWEFTITLLRRGLSRNGRIEYAHPTTLTAALVNRQTLEDEPSPESSA